MNAKHSSASKLWYTPADVIEMAREVLGEIDLDPASDHVANETVRATGIVLEGGERWQDWDRDCSVWLNPPGGWTAARASSQLVFWQALQWYRLNGYLKHAIFLAFSIELLQTSQGWCGAMNYPLCIPSKRIRFVSPAGKKNNPTHANALIYVPGTVDRTDDFIRVFSALGACKR